MENFPFGRVALVIGIALFVSAVFVFLAEYFALSEDNPISIVIWGIILFVSILEFPVHSISQSLGFPIVVPLIVFSLSTVSFIRNKSQKIFSIMAVLLTIVSVLLFLAVRHIL